MPAAGEACPAVLPAPFSLGDDVNGNSVCCASYRNPPEQIHIARPLPGQIPPGELPCSSCLSSVRMNVAVSGDATLEESGYVALDCNKFGVMSVNWEIRPRHVTGHQTLSGYLRLVLVSVSPLAEESILTWGIAECLSSVGCFNQLALLTCITALKSGYNRSLGCLQT